MRVDNVCTLRIGSKGVKMEGRFKHVGLPLEFVEALREGFQQLAGDKREIHVTEDQHGYYFSVGLIHDKPQFRFASITLKSEGSGEYHYVLKNVVNDLIIIGHIRYDSRKEQYSLYNPTFRTRIGDFTFEKLVSQSPLTTWIELAFKPLLPLVN